MDYETITSFSREMVELHREFNKLWKDITDSTNGVKLSKRDLILNTKLQIYKGEIEKVKLKKEVYNLSDMIKVSSILSDLLLSLKLTKSKLKKR